MRVNRSSKAGPRTPRPARVNLTRPAAAAVDPLERRMLMAVDTWNGTSADWSTAADWSLGRVPTPTDDAVVASGSVTVSTPQTPGTLTFLGGSITGSGNLSAIGLFTWSGGTISVAQATAAGGLAVAGGGSVFLSGGTLTVPAGATGTIGATGAVTLYLNDGATLANAGTLAVGGGAQVAYPNYGNGGDAFVNTGTLAANGSGGGFAVGGYGLAFNSSGTVLATAGTLTLGGGGGGTETGQFNASAGATIAFTGTETLAAGTTAAGAGVVTVAGGSPSVPAGVSVGGTPTVSGGTLTLGAGATFGVPLAVTGGTVAFAAANASYGAVVQTGGNVTVAGGLTVTGPYTQAGGTVAGAGTLTVDGPYTWSGGTLSAAQTTAAGGLAVAGGGSVFLSGGTLTVPAGATGTIGATGAVTLYLNDGATLANAGTLAVGGGAQVAYPNYGNGGDAFVNTGTLAANGSGGGFAVGGYGLAFNSSGTVLATAGTLTLGGGGGGTETGQFNASAGATIAFTGTETLAAGTTAAGAGVVTVAGGSPSVPAGVSVGGTPTVSGGTLTLGAGATFGVPLAVTGGTVAFAAANASYGAVVQTGGNVTVAGGLTVTGPYTQAGGTVAGAGTLTVDGPYTWSGGTLSAAQTTAAGGLAVAGGGSVFLSGGTLTVPAGATGTIGATGAVTLYLNDGATLANAGTLAVGGGAQVAYPNYGNGGDAFVNTGTLAANGSGGGFAVGGYGLAFNSSGTVNVVSGGTFSVPASDVTQVSGATLAGGTWLVAGTLNISGVNLGTNQGNVTLNGTSSNFGAIASLNTNSGTFALASGRAFTTVGPLTNTGTISLGAGSTLTVSGAYTQSAQGTLATQINGTPGSGQIGVLAATGTAALDGTVAVSVGGGFAPTAANYQQFYAGYTVVTFASHTGTFAGVSSPTVAGTVFTAVVNAGSVVLQAQGIPAVTATDVSSVYNGSPYPTADVTPTAMAFNGAVTLPDGTFSYSYFTANGTPLAGAPSAGGTYSLVINYSGDPYFAAASSAPVSFTIGRATPTVVVTSTTNKTYDGNPAPATSSLTGVPGAVAPTGTVTLTYYAGSTATGTGTTTPPAAGGTYTVVAGYAGDGNYQPATSGPATFVISAAVPTLTVAGNTETYNGNPDPANYSLAGVAGGAMPTGAVTLTYYAGSTATGTGTTTPPIGVGIYTVVASYAGDGNYQAATSSSSTFAIYSAVPVPLVLTGPAFYLRLDPNGRQIDVYANATGTGTPQQTPVTTSVSQVVVNNSGNDAVVVDFSNGDPLTGGGLSFTGGGTNNTLTVVGSGGNDTLTVGATTLTVAGAYGSATIQYARATQVTFNGGGGTDAVVQTAQPGGGAGFTFAGASAADDLTVTGGTFTLPAGGGGGVGGVTAEAFGAVSIGGTGRVSVPAANGLANRVVLVVNSLSFAGSAGAWQGQLDLSGNDLVVRNGNLAAIGSQLAGGFNAGRGYWNGPGIASSAAAEDPGQLTALGSMQPTAAATFDGRAVGPTDVLVKYTYYGDANLDGAVDGQDYARIDAGFLGKGGLTGWANGDFNDDGKVDASDYTLIDNAFNEQAFAVPTAEVAAPSAAAASRPAAVAVTAGRPAALAVSPPPPVVPSSDDWMRKPKAATERLDVLK